MKKITGTLALVLAVFSILYFSNSALASKASFDISPLSQTCDVSSGIGASFQLLDLDGASSVCVEVLVPGGISYTTVTGLGAITSTGTYTRTAAQMQNQFGNFSGGSWRVKDNNNSSHVSGALTISVQD